MNVSIPYGAKLYSTRAGMVDSKGSSLCPHTRKPGPQEESPLEFGKGPTMA